MKRIFHQRGQGLVEYALILVLVVIVVIVILSILGPAVGNVFSNIVVAIGGGVITSVSANYTPPSGPAPSKLSVTVMASQTTSVTLTGPGISETKTCLAGIPCHFGDYSGVPEHGTVTASAGGSQKSASW